MEDESRILINVSLTERTPVEQDKHEALAGSTLFGPLLGDGFSHLFGL